MRRFAGTQIAIFSAQYLPHVGGVENYTFHIARTMASQGVHATVVTLGIGTSVCQDEDPAGFSIVRLPSRQLLGGRYPIARPLSLPRHALDGRHVDYVVVNTRFYPHSLSGVMLAQDRGIRPVVIDHGSAHLTMGNALVDTGVAGIEHLMTSFVKRYPADFYGVSKRSSEWLNHFGIESCGELYNSIDAEAYADSASSCSLREKFGVGNAALVAFVGRLAPEKGVHQLVEAARSVPSAHFILAGDGPLRDALSSHASANVHFAGVLAPADVAALLTQADLFCLPTRSEGFATSLLEAAACGTPALITDVGGARELIADESYGTIIEDARPATLAAALNRALANREALEAQGARVQKRVTQLFSWEATTQRILLACERANHCK